MITSPPQKIFLNTQIDTESDFKDLSGVTWSENRINDTDIEYTIKPEQSFRDFIDSLGISQADKYLIKGVYLGWINKA